MEAAGTRQCHISPPLHRSGKWQASIRASERFKRDKRGILYRPKHRKNDRALQFGNLYQYQFFERSLCPDDSLTQERSNEELLVRTGHMYLFGQILLSTPPVWQKEYIRRDADEITDQRGLLVVPHQADFKYLQACPGDGGK